MTVSWPDVLKPSRWTGPDLIGSYVSGGRTGSGREQRVFSDAGYWRLSYTIPIRTRAQVLAWRAMAGRLAASEPVVAKIYTLQKAKGAQTGSAVVGVAAPPGATELIIVPTGIEVEPGVPLSIGDRLYRVMEVVPEGFDGTGSWDDGEPWSDAEVWPDEPAIPPGAMAVRILPPTRAAVPAGHAVDFDDLWMLCVPEDPSALSLDLDLGKFADPTLTLIEAL